MSPRTQSAQRRQPGRQSRGERITRTVRYPDGWEAQLERNAAAVGVDGIGNYITMLVAKSEGFPVPPYIVDEIAKTNREREARRAEELDLPRTA